MGVRTTALAALLAALQLLALARANAASSVTVETVIVEPQSPGPDTLCKLRVQLKNASERPVSSLVFRVKINGQELGLYGKQVFMHRLEPHSTLELPLYNFWSTESGRPAPKDGYIAVEVALAEARYGDGGPQAEPVGGLPSSASARLGFRAAPGR